MGSIPSSVPQKQCTKCKRWFPRTTGFFTLLNTPRGNKDGFYPQCKECKTARQKTYRERTRKSSDVPDGYRMCRSCKQIKPETPEYFSPHKASRNHLNAQCKECGKVARYRSVEKATLRRTQVPQPQEKRCSKCFQVKAATPEYFTVCNRNADGFLTYCKPCERLHRVTYYALHREQSRIKRIQETPEYKAHKTQRNREWRRQNSTRFRAKRRQYYQANIARMRQINAVARQKRRARKNAVTGTHTASQIQEKLKRQHYRCYYCSAKFEKKDKRYDYHIEHTFPLSRASGSDDPINSIDYLVLACPHCNSSKQNKYPWEWPEGGRLL